MIVDWFWFIRGIVSISIFVRYPKHLTTRLLLAELGKPSAVNSSDGKGKEAYP